MKQLPLRRLFGITNLKNTKDNVKPQSNLMEKDSGHLMQVSLNLKASPNMLCLLTQWKALEISGRASKYLKTRCLSGAIHGWCPFPVIATLRFISTNVKKNPPPIQLLPQEEFVVLLCS